MVGAAGATRTVTGGVFTIVVDGLEIRVLVIEEVVVEMLLTGAEGGT